MPQFWKITLEIPHRHVVVAEDAFSDIGIAFSSVEKNEMEAVRIGFNQSAEVVPEDAIMVLEILTDSQPKTDDITARIAMLEAMTDLENIPYSIALVPEVDWLQAVQDSLPPVYCNRFYLYGSHHAKPLQNRANLGLHVDAATAFGSGHHETTFGCLLMLLYLAKRWQPSGDVLDIGCGTGILAMAAMRLWPSLCRHAPNSPCLRAVDIDAEAVKVTKENLKKNALSPYGRVAQSAGFKSSFIVRSSKRQLILANILANPLLGMARDISSHLDVGGYVILAGLLSRQASRILARYQSHGLYLQHKIRQGDWTILLLRKTAKPVM